jgi:hypothetical protein
MMSLFSCIRADPFGTAAQSFEGAQKLMIDEQSYHYRDAMTQLQNDVKKMSGDRLQLIGI